ncbi:hypothetical protein CVT26_013043 [Gymnopilus dilepis]|uniref:Uncharacterized protein n=1 Tax=Gymnopilus dilepis TaxID=231916 RepID=A0A409Y4B0_9AGAR|nr:hypothetical protein CVT26_013043 [Gymnopilus dilepis]
MDRYLEIENGWRRFLSRTFAQPGVFQSTAEGKRGRRLADIARCAEVSSNLGEPDESLYMGLSRSIYETTDSRRFMIIAAWQPIRWGNGSLQRANKSLSVLRAGPRRQVCRKTLWLVGDLEERPWAELAARREHAGWILEYAARRIRAGGSDLPVQGSPNVKERNHATGENEAKPGDALPSAQVDRWIFSHKYVFAYPLFQVS